MKINVTAINHAPAGTDKTVSFLEDGTYTFTATDFGFSDPNDPPANSRQAVKITSPPLAGTLKDNGVAVTTGQFVPVADITGNKLVFTPAANANGSHCESFPFHVRDDGLTANGGVDLDQSPNTMTINVTAINPAPAGTHKSVTSLKTAPSTSAATDFGFSDHNYTPANALHSFPTRRSSDLGTLKDNGVAVTTGQFVPVADITSNKLVFTPAANANG